MSSPSSNGNRTAISIETKLEVLQALRDNKSQIEVAREFGLGYSTVKKIKKNERELLRKVSKSSNLNRIRDRPSPNEAVGDALIAWYREMRLQNKSINGPIMMEKARELGLSMGFEGFKPSHGWLERLKARNNIRFQKPLPKTSPPKQNGSKQSNHWIENVLPKLLEGYDRNDVFNAVETALFYKAAPSILTGNREQNGIIAKDRLTVLVMCNSTGTEKHAFVIGKDSNPSCFDTEGTPMPYYSSKDALMTDFIWQDSLRKLDQNLSQRKIVLFVSKAECHKMKLKLKNIKVVLVPSDPSIFQPMDKGIIRMLKIHYRYRLLKKMIFASNRGILVSDFAKTINLLKALCMLDNALSSIPAAVVVDCFQKAGFYSDDVCCLDELPDMSDEAKELREILADEFDSFVECDKNVDCFELSVITNPQPSPSVASGKCDTAPVEPQQIDDALPKVTPEEALDALSVVRKYLDENLIETNSYYDLEEIVRLCSYGNCSTEMTHSF